MSLRRDFTTLDVDDLIAHSVQSLLTNQRDNGAIIASPDFSQYHFCWLRDASFCSYAMDLAGESAASSRYHDWVRRAVEGIHDMMTTVTVSGRSGVDLNAEMMPPARFSMEGAMVHDDWPNFQIDGYGTWLWSLARHLELSGRAVLPDGFVDVVSTVAAYVSEFALSSCFDVWEENGSDRHTSTLACIYGGLVAASELLGDPSYAQRADEVRAVVNASGTRVGHFTKSDANLDVDGSVVWLSAPFGLIHGDDATFRETVALIESCLDLSGGIRRYPTDVYFGSGAWPVLTASLGWHLAESGDLDKARRCLDWVIGRFDERGRLGEQFGGEDRDRENYDRWVQRWGHPAQDLMWSHAMFIILATAVARAEGAVPAHDDVRVSEGNEPGGQTT